MKKITLLLLLVFTVYSYGQTQLLSRIDEVFNGAIWQNSSGYNYEYDSNDNLESETFFIWNGSFWAESDKTTFTYNANNKATEEIDQFYNGTQYENSDRTVYTYDGTTGDIIRVEGYDWQSGWVEEFRSNFRYSAGVLTGGTSEEYDGSDWENSFNAEITYNANGTISQIVDEEWDTVNDIWVLESRTVFSYDASDNISMVTYEERNGGVWEEDSNIVYVVDGNGNRTSETENFTIGGGSETITYMYDNSALMSDFANPFADYTDLEYLLEDYPYYNKILSSTTGASNRTTYNYDNLLSTDDILNRGQVDFKIYPNPAEDFVTVKSSESIKNIDVFSVLGSKILSTSDINLNISQFSKGIYLMNISLDNGSIVSKKLVKE